MSPVRHTERALVGEAAIREHSSGKVRFRPDFACFILRCGPYWRCHRRGGSGHDWLFTEKQSVSALPRDQTSTCSARDENMETAVAKARST